MSSLSCLSVDVSECRINVDALYRGDAICASRRGLSRRRRYCGCRLPVAIDTHMHVHCRVANSSTPKYRDTVTITETEESLSRDMCAGWVNPLLITRPSLLSLTPAIFRRDRRENKITPARGDNRLTTNSDIVNRYQWVSACNSL